jgi:hypothetical protein
MISFSYNYYTIIDWLSYQNFSGGHISTSTFYVITYNYSYFIFLNFNFLASTCFFFLGHVSFSSRSIYYTSFEPHHHHMVHINKKNGAISSAGPHQEIRITDQSKCFLCIGQFLFIYLLINIYIVTS